jgi:hypothetical protein
MPQRVARSGDHATTWQETVPQHGAVAAPLVVEILP